MVTRCFESLQQTKHKRGEGDFIERDGEYRVQALYQTRQNH